MIERARIGVVAVTAIACAAACSKREPVKAEPVPSASVSATAPASVVSASAVTSASAVPTMAPTEAPEAAPTAFHVVAEAAGDMSFVPGSGGALLFPADGGMVVEIRGDRATPAYGFWDGLAPYRGVNHAGNIEGFGGRWPNQVYAQIGAYGQRGTTDHQIHVFRNGSWSPVIASGNDMSAISAVETYKSGFVAAVQRFDGTVDLELSGVSGHFSPRAPAKDKACPTRIREVTSLWAPPGGGLIAMGRDCDGGDDAIEIFGDDGKSTGFHALPDLAAPRIAAVSTAEVYIAGMPAPPAPVKAAPAAASASAAASGSAAPSASAVASASAGPRASAAPGAPSLPVGQPYFAVLRGGAWVPQPMPGGALPTSLDAGPDGSLWAVAGGAVWRRPRGAAWGKVPLPEGAQATDVMVGSAADVWAVERGKETMKIYRTKAPKYAVVAGYRGPAEPSHAPPATATCATPFVLLYSVGNAPADYTFPLTRKAMKGHAELAGTTVVLTEAFQLGAFVPSLEVGEKLAAVIREGVKGQKPQVVCDKPRVRAEIAFDLATGEITR